MRTKTEFRRRAIIDAALQVFRDVGYQKASMEMIAERFGGSKVTVYNYFASKADLFAVAMIEMLDDSCGTLAAVLDSTNSDVARVLCEFGEGYINMVTSSEVLSLVRAVLSDIGEADFACQYFYKSGPERTLKSLASYLKGQQELGNLSAFDPGIAATHLKALYEAGSVEPLLYLKKPKFRARKAAALAVEAFLRAYPRSNRRDDRSRQRRVNAGPKPEPER